MKILQGGLALLFSIILLGIGIDNLSHSAEDSARASRYPHPVTLTYEQFVQRRPTEGWFRVTGGIINLVSASASRKSFRGGLGEHTTAVIAPLHSGTHPGASAPCLMVVSTDPALCDAWDHLYDVQQGLPTDDTRAVDRNVPRNKSDEELAEARLDRYVDAHPEKAFFVRDVEGIIWPGDDPKAIQKGDAVATTLFAIPEGMDAHYVRLDEGTTGADYQKHHTAAGIIALVLAGICAIWPLVLGLSARRRRNQPPPPPRPGSPLPAPISSDGPARVRDLKRQLDD